MLAETIWAIHVASRGCYGVRRMHAELTIGMGIEVGSGQVHSIMKTPGVQGISVAGSICGCDVLLPVVALACSVTLEIPDRHRQSL
ncbi:IS3 family transposase [Nocardia salmonicida]|uniref:IS3 family transposase n=1 Tax=Nocardia salmonicida TaxID=53431 RepID=UPI0007A394A1|nr:IS3 family transposase [Nocardia salmonicida]